MKSWPRRADSSAGSAASTPLDPESSAIIQPINYSPTSIRTLSPTWACFSTNTPSSSNSTLTQESHHERAYLYEKLQSTHAPRYGQLHWLCLHLYRPRRLQNRRVTSILRRATTLTYLKDRLNATPINALQNRASAHFTEINSYYMHEMAKKFIEK